ncbi:MAG: sialate O-acetylesterase, partial [Verrucomicrobiaceae bacterium]
LKRSQFTGKITVTLSLNNGGADVKASAPITVTEPATDAWVQRVPAKDEKPEDNQLYARDDKNEGTLFYNGTLDQAADSIFLKVTADGKSYKAGTLKPAADKSYAFTVKLKPGLIKYKVEFGTKSGVTETVLHTVNNIVCGDAYIIDGQSNAEATGPNNGPGEDPPTSFNDWIRSYGNQHQGSIKGGWGNAVRTHIWGKQNYGDHQIGAWGMVLANGLVEKYQIPVCILNGAYGGTPIWQHQRNPENHFDTSGEFYKNPYKIYGGMLTRVTAAKLTHGIRGILWHQGENDQGSGAPTGDYNWKSWQQYWVDMAAAWKEDYPNIRHYYVWQIWPSGCNMGGTHSGDMLLDVQRTLPTLFSNMRVMSTMGIISKSSGRGLCHFDMEGYAQIAQLMSPLVEQDNYGFVPKQPMTAPNLKRAGFTNVARDEITLDFGQPMAWKDDMKRYIYLDNVAATISSGSASGNFITLKLAAPSNAKTIGYLAGRDWDGTPVHLVHGTNGIAALTFCDVPLSTK